MTPLALRLAWNAEAALALLLAWLLVLLLPVKRLLALAGRIGDGTDSARDRSLVPEPRRLEGMIGRLARWIPRCRCLPRALAAQLVWRRRGYRTRLRLGVRQGTDGFEAHAWLERDGTQVFGMTGGEPYVRFAKL
jgi:hypothetical protein